MIRESAQGATVEVEDLSCLGGVGDEVLLYLESRVGTVSFFFGFGRGCYGGGDNEGIFPIFFSHSFVREGRDC
jgi:hypothetical protein